MKTNESLPKQTKTKQNKLMKQTSNREAIIPEKTSTIVQLYSNRGIINS